MRRRPRLAIADPLAVVPLQPARCGTPARQPWVGRKLRRTVRPTGMRKRIADLFNYDYSRKLELDEYGTLFLQPRGWPQIAPRDCYRHRRENRRRG